MSKIKELDLINKAKDRIKKSDVVKNLCKEYDVDVDILDIVPICFKDLDVSARTDHGCIYLNNKLIDQDFSHYLVHELTHFFQQCFGTKPTKGSTDENYLDNPYEQEGFQNQTQYISDEKGKEVADQYIEKVLTHHDVTDEDEREDKKEKLLNRKAMLIYLYKNL